MSNITVYSHGNVYFFKRLYYSIFRLFLAYPCPAYSTYDHAVTGSPATCENFNVTANVSLICNKTMEGCVCNDGFLLSGNFCVPISECGCWVDWLTEDPVYYPVLFFFAFKHF